MTHDRTRSFALGSILLFLGSTLVVPTGAAVTPVQAIGFGFPHDEVAKVNGDGGVQIAYCSMWMVGKITSGSLTNLQTWIRDCGKNNSIPVIHWYYWGGNVGNVCVSKTDPAHTDPNACANKNQQDWFIGAYSIANTTRDQIAGGYVDEAWVTIELEFNQNGTDQNSGFAHQLKLQSDIFQERGIKTVAPFGSWSEPFSAFSEFLGDVDAVGSQILKACTQSPHNYAEMSHANRDLQTWFWDYNNWSGSAKPLMIFDWGLATYNGSSCYQGADVGADFEGLQKNVTDEFFNKGYVDTFRSLGVFAWVYRLRSDPGGSSGFYGPAEQYFGFMRNATVYKPAYPFVLNGIAAEARRVPNAAPLVKVWEKEAESFATKSTGASFNDGSASGGQAWNIWANGYINDTFSVPAATSYTLNVTARGDWAGGIPPQMKITVDATVVSTVNVTSTTVWSNYTSQVNLTSGSHALKIEFTNDAIIGGEDRNLKVDKASVWQPSAEWLLQAESFTTKTAGASFADANASAGVFWNLWSNGSINTTMHVETGGTNVLRVAASGDVALGVWPEMKVYVNNTQVLDVFVNHSAWTTYRVNISYAQGDYPLRIQFVNDYYDPSTGADRNLKLDYAIASPALSSRWSLEAESFGTHTTGAAAPDNGASGLLYWNLWGNGYISNSFTTGLSGTQDIRLVLRPDPAGGIWPHMKVYVDSTVVADMDVTVSGWSTYVISADFGAGTHTLKIEYTNDGVVGTDDRNLNADIAYVYA